MELWRRIVTPEILIAIGTALFLGGTAIVTLGTVLSTQRIEHITTDVAEQAKIIRHVATESFNQLTSAGSFCHIQASVAPDNSIGFTLLQDGDYPIFDVVVRILDSAASKRFWEEFRQGGKTTLSSSDLNAAQGLVFFDRVGTLMKGGEIPSLTSVPPATPAELRRFEIFINTRNGLYLETIKMIKAKEQWLFNEQLNSVSLPGPPLWQHISPNFPKNSP
jgi:hypothetical protein